MAIVGKLLVVLLVWIMVGVIFGIVVVIRHEIRINALDPKRMNELMSESFSMASYGIFDKDDEVNDYIRKTEHYTGERFFGIIVKSLIIWPSIWGSTSRMLDEAYKKMKYEYDMGIRTRKEAS